MEDKSHLTAITRKRVSTPCNWLSKKELLKGRCLDYGCGKGKDADTLGMEKYDPYHFPQLPTGKFDTITCIYVLNVVQERERSEILRNISKYLAVGGKAYLAVRRDIKKEGYTKRLTWQENVILPYRVVYESPSRFVIYEIGG